MQNSNFDRSNHFEQSFSLHRMSGSSVSSVESNSSAYNSSSANIQRNYGSVRLANSSFGYENIGGNRSTNENQYRLVAGEMYYGSTEDTNANMYSLSHNGSLFSPATSREASMGYGQEVYFPTISSDLSVREFSFTKSLSENISLFKSNDGTNITSNNILQSDDTDGHTQFKFQSNGEFRFTDSIRGGPLNDVESSIRGGLPDSGISISSSSSIYGDISMNAESYNRYGSTKQPLHTAHFANTISVSKPQNFVKGLSIEQANGFDVTATKSATEDSMEHRMAISLPRGTSLPQHDDVDGILNSEKDKVHGSSVESSNMLSLPVDDAFSSEQSRTKCQATINFCEVSGARQCQL